MISGLITNFGLLGFDFIAPGVDPEPLRVDIWSLQVNLEPLGVDLGPLGVKFGPLRVDFGPLRIEFRFFGINLGLVMSMLGL